ncbi:MAG: LPP20 family lipoprotein [Candidatus Marinimicrobia bacterium]|nr:LPP20 family lipoprotein [Candidatus Neomarinimicrobiota bacterium]
MQFNKKYLLLLIILFVFQLWAKTPEWVTSGEHYRYPSSQYFLGIGIAGERSQAIERARADLIKQIKVKIESELTTEEKEIAAKNKIETSSTIISKTKSSVDATVSGIEMAEVVQSNNKYYALAILNKSNYFQSLKTEIDKIIEESNQLIDHARSNIDSGRIFNAFENYNRASAIVTEYEPKNNLLVSLTGKSYRQKEIYSEEDVIAEMRNIISNLEIELIDGGQQTGMSGEYLPDQISVQVLYTRHHKTGVRNFPVIVRYQDGELISKLRTNAQGLTNFRIKAIPTGMETGSGAAEVMMASELLPANIRDLLSRSKVVVHYSIRTPDIQFALKPDENENYQELTKKIENIITGSGFQLNPEAPLSIRYDHEILNEREINSPFGTQYLIEVGVNFQMVKNKSGATLASYMVKGKGLSKKSKEDAIKVALQRIDIQKDDFVTFLTKGNM